MEITMLTKIALAAALVLGAAAAAQAGSKDDYCGNCGGFHVGPLGQWFGGPAFRPRYWGYRRYHRDYGYAFVPRYERHWYYYR
jgi:hypothetical protein